MRADMRRRVLFLLIAATGLLLLVIWLTKPAPAADLPALGASASVAAPPSASAQPNPFWDLAAQASAKADAASEPLDLQRWEAEWCRAPSERTDSLTPDQQQALLESAPFREVSAALAVRRRDRLRALRQPRADAMFEALQTQSNSFEAMAQLRERARNSDDAFIVALALQNACTEAGCQRELSRRWQQLEPHNLHAYLWELRSGDRSTVPAVLAGVAQASSSKSYYYEFMDLLREASSTPSKGPLALMLETDLIKSTGGRNSQSYVELVSMCQESRSGGGLTPLCAAAGEKIWALNEEMLMLAMVSAVMAKAQAEPLAHWRERNRLIEAVKQVLRDTRHTADTEGLARHFDAAMRCQPLEPGLHQQIWLEPEWRLLKRTVQQKEMSAVSGEAKQSRPSTPPVP